MRILTASDRNTLIKLASSLPKGDETRKAILAGLSQTKTSSYLSYTAEALVDLFAKDRYNLTYCDEDLANAAGVPQDREVLANAGKIIERAFLEALKKELPRIPLPWKRGWSGGVGNYNTGKVLSGMNPEYTVGVLGDHDFNPAPGSSFSHPSLFKMIRVPDLEPNPWKLYAHLLPYSDGEDTLVSYHIGYGAGMR